MSNKSNNKFVVRNDLLNFQYEYHHQTSSVHSIYEDRNALVRRKYFSYQPFRRDKYVLSNFHFVVRPPSQINNTGSKFYYEALFDPDVLVDWSAIELVLLKTIESIECPICLEYPKAAKLTKCGHILCYPCIIQYLSLGEKDFRKCPVCNESIYMEELKSVTIQQKQELKVGQQMEMALMKCSKDNIVPFRIENEQPPHCTIFPHFEELDACFCRYNVIYNIKPIIEKELVELQDALAFCDQTNLLETQFINIATQFVQKREEDFKSWTKINLPHGQPKQKARRNSKKEDLPKKEFKTGSEEAFGIDIEENFEPTIPKPSSKQSQSYNLHPHNPIHSPIHTQQHSNFRYYYQSVDEQMLFLDPLNMKMLLMQYGNDFESLPPRIKANIIEMKHIQMDEHFRKRNTYFHSVPLGADLALVEMDVTPFISKETYKQFEKEVVHRAQHRLKKQQKDQLETLENEMKEEEERRMRFEELEKRKMDFADQEVFPSIEDVAEKSKQNEEATTETLFSSNSITIPSRQYKEVWSDHISKSLEKKLEDEFPSLSSFDKRSQKQNKQLSQQSKRDKPEKSKGKKKDIVLNLF